jgi:hypothetical protein
VLEGLKEIVGPYKLFEKGDAEETEIAVSEQ